MRLLTTGASVAAAVLLVGIVPAAHAGEVTGNGKSTPIRDHVASSICAFSGLDDEDDDGFGRTQNWGSIPKADRDFLSTVGAHPGDACRGNVTHEE